MLKRRGKKIRDYLVQPTQFTDGEIEICTTEWDRRTIQSVIVNWLVAEFGKELLRPSLGWFPLNLSISFFLWVGLHFHEYQMCQRQHLFKKVLPCIECLLQDKNSTFIVSFKITKILLSWPHFTSEYVKRQSGYIYMCVISIWAWIQIQLSITLSPLEWVEWNRKDNSTWSLWMWPYLERASLQM